MAFQQARGLRTHGRCDDATWAALVEASWRLGDRILYHVSPNLRGDDVADIQTLLARLGFDCGRVDGIFGPDTASALEDFQRNCGLTVDGACGRHTITALRRLSRHSGEGPGISMVREAETIRAPHLDLRGHRIVVGHFGGLAPVVRAVARMVRVTGADVITLDEPDSTTQATAANRFEAEVYLGLEARACPGIEVAYYSVPAFTSPGGHMLGHLLEQHLQPFSSPPAGVDLVGLRLPILRETRMPAVMLTLGPVRPIVDQAAHVAEAIVASLDQWVRLAHDTP